MGKVRGSRRGGGGGRRDGDQGGGGRRRRVNPIEPRPSRGGGGTGGGRRGRGNKSRGQRSSKGTLHNKANNESGMLESTLESAKAQLKQAMNDVDPGNEVNGMESASKEPENGNGALKERTSIEAESDESDEEIELKNDEELGLLPTSDPFIGHFEKLMPDRIQEILKGGANSYSLSINCEWPALERFRFSGLPQEESKNCSIDDVKEKSSGGIETDLSSVSEGQLLQLPKPPCATLEEGKINPVNLFIKPQLVPIIPKANENVGLGPDLSSLQKELLLLSSSYHDLYYSKSAHENQNQIRMAYCIHVANHVLKTRSRIIHHNAKLANKVEVPEEYRDQGFARPKVLILVPFRESAKKIVTSLSSLILKDEKGTLQHKDRFYSEFGGETLFMPKTNPKPQDYMDTFAGNIDDNFKLGIAVTKKSMKLFSEFYASDIIIASPLGLRLVIGAEGEKNRDFDFLSSIEVLVIDQADVFLMQNWDHLLHVIRHLHLQPLSTHETDFSRIRPWALDGLSKYYSQTLVFSSQSCPEHVALFSRYCRNFGGLVKVLPPISTGLISQITVQLPQVFQQFEANSVQEASQARFDYFVQKVFPEFKGKLMSHTLIWVSSYFDFVRLRNHFKREEANFVQICEYTKDKKIARARDLFFHGQNHFLLYSERAHFFRRFRLKGIGHIIFYQLPQYPHFYPELCNAMQEEFQTRRVRQRKNCSVNVIYCKYDAPRLSGIVGTEKANYMLSSDKKIHAFVSGGL